MKESKTEQERERIEKKYFKISETNLTVSGGESPGICLCNMLS